MMDKEYTSLISSGTWKLTKLPEGREVKSELIRERPDLRLKASFAPLVRLLDVVWRKLYISQRIWPPFISFIVIGVIDHHFLWPWAGVRSIILKVSLTIEGIWSLVGIPRSTTSPNASNYRGLEKILCRGDFFEDYGSPKFRTMKRRLEGCSDQQFKVK